MTWQIIRNYEISSYIRNQHWGLAMWVDILLPISSETVVTGNDFADVNEKPLCDNNFQENMFLEVHPKQSFSPVT